MKARLPILPLGMLPLLLALTVPRPASAYLSLKTGGGNETTWNKSLVPWYLHPDGSGDAGFAQVQAAIRGAFNAWQQVPCATLGFTEAGTATSAQSGAIFLKWEEAKWNPAVGDAAAFTVSDKTFGGTLTSSVIVFNGVKVDWTVSASASKFGLLTDIQGVATHEIGHAIGLDHPLQRDATMFFSGGSSDLRSLAPDDEKGACYLYPAVPFDDGDACDSCTQNSQCANGVCLSFPWEGAGFCGRNCNVDADCGEPFTCTQVEGVGGQCAPRYDYCTGNGGNIPLGGYCWAGAMCKTGICIPVPGDAFCARSCSPSSPGSCPSGFICLDAGGGQGYCLKSGSKAFGEPCETNLECKSNTCALGVCSTVCSSSAQCPSGAPCPQGFCVPPGDSPYGGSCTRHTDCATGFCSGIPGNYCTQACKKTPDCPESATCINNAICSKLSKSSDGGPCATDGECLSGLSCIRTSPNTGACRVACDPVADTGCPAGRVCRWFYDVEKSAVRGGCLDHNGAGDAGAACGEGAGFCAPHLYCVLGACVRDCRMSDGAGCAAPATCMSFNDPVDTERGVCVDTTRPLPDAGPGPDTGSKTDTATAADPGEGASDPGVGPAPDPGPGTDLRTVHDLGDARVSVPGTPAGGGGGGGGCESGGSAVPPTGILLLLLGLLALLRPRETSP